MVLRSRLMAMVMAACVLAAALLAGCGGDDDGGTGGATPPPPPSGGGVTVNMGDNTYSPGSLTARVGQAATFDVVNGGAALHTFTITGVVDSGIMEAGARKSVSFTPTSPGTLTFFCTVHGQALMSGTLTVSASSALPASEDETPS